MKCRQYITETKIYYENSSTPSNCNSILFINSGTIAVTVENVLLQPGQQLAIDGNADEMCVKIFYFTFAATTGGSLTVVYKRYL